MVGGFSASFDLISSEYGWTDKQVGNLPLARFRQIAAAIAIRKFQQAREENSRVSWMTRTLATYIAAGFMTDGKSKNPYLEKAPSLAMDQFEEALLKVAAETRSQEPDQGSHEKLMRFAGSMQAKP